MASDLFANGRGRSQFEAGGSKRVGRRQSPRPGQAVELGPARVLGLAPLGVEPAGPLESLERGEEGAGIDLEDIPRNLFDPAGNAEAVEWVKAQGLEDQ